MALLLLLAGPGYSWSALAGMVPEVSFIPPERHDLEKVQLQEVVFSVEEVDAQTHIMPISKTPASFQEQVWRTMLILDRSTETDIALLEVREKDLDVAKKLKEYLVKYQGARPDSVLISLREEGDPIPGDGRMIVHFAEDAVARAAKTADVERMNLSQAAAVPAVATAAPVPPRMPEFDPWPSPFTGKPRRTRTTESLPQSGVHGSVLAQGSDDRIALSQASAVRSGDSSTMSSVFDALGVKQHSPSWTPSRYSFNFIPEFATAETFQGQDVATRATGVWFRARANAAGEIYHRPIVGIGPEIDFAQSLASFSGEGRTLSWWDGFAGLRFNLRANTKRFWIPNLGASLGVSRMSRNGAGVENWISGYEGLEARVALNLPIDSGFQIGLESGYLTGRTDEHERFRSVELGAHLDQELGFGIYGSEVRARLGATASLRGAASQQETVTTVLLGFTVGML